MNKQILTLILFFSIVTVFSSCNPQESRTNIDANKIVMHLDNQLELTDSQKVEIKTIVFSFLTTKEDLMNGKEVPSKESFKQISQECNSKIKDVLTAEQQKKFKPIPLHQARDNDRRNDKKGNKHAKQNLKNGKRFACKDSLNGHQDHVASVLEEMQKELQLTDDQMTEIKQTFQSRHDNMRKEMQKGEKGKREQRKNKANEVMNNTDQEMKRILNSDSNYEKWETTYKPMLRPQRSEQRGEQRESREGKHSQRERSN